jgi:glycosyltransferase involved in cell wall biosynthesis
LAGTGLKIKTVEALCHGAAVVAWPNGVDGLGRALPGAFRVAESWEGFAEAVVDLLRNPLERARQQEAALAYARESFARDAVYAPLKKALEDHLSSLASTPATVTTASTTG